MGIFSRNKEEVEPTPAHYIDVSMVKGTGWQFNHDTEDEAQATLQRIVDAMNNGDKVIRHNNVVLNVDQIKYANYRNYHRSYYF